MQTSKSSKVSYPGPLLIHSKCISGLGRALAPLALVLGLLLAATCPAAAATRGTSPGSSRPASPAENSAGHPCLFEPGHDSLIMTGLQSMYDMEYAAADSLFSRLPAGSPGRAYFRGLNRFNRFNDLGDRLSLHHAESLWISVAESGGAGPRASRNPLNIDLYRGLSTLQLSYVAKVSGHGVRAAHLGRKAAGLLRPVSGHAEADAALALYDYYRAALLKGVEWLPFVKADAAEPLRRLEAGAPKSRYLAEVLHTSLIWLYYDAGRYEDGLRLVDGFLARHPKSRIYRQIRADFLYRRGMSGAPAPAADLAEAREIHDELLRE